MVPGSDAGLSIRARERWKGIAAAGWLRSGLGAGEEAQAEAREPERGFHAATAFDPAINLNSTFHCGSKEFVWARAFCLVMEAKRGVGKRQVSGRLAELGHAWIDGAD